MIEGGFLLISSNRGYELDAFLEAFAVAAEHGLELELFGVVEDGRAVATLVHEDQAANASLLSELNEPSGGLRFVRRVTLCSMIGRLSDLDNACDVINGRLRRVGDSSRVAVKLEGISFRDPLRTRTISNVLRGLRNIDLRRPDILIYFYIGDRFFLAGFGPVAHLYLA